MSRDKFVLTEIFYDVYNNLMQPSDKKIIRTIEDKELEQKLENFLIDMMGYSNYRQYCKFIENKVENFEYFAGIRKYFENVIVNYDFLSGMDLFDFLDTYVENLNSYLASLPYVNIFIRALKNNYSNDPEDVILSHQGKKFVISRQTDKYKNEPPAAIIENIENLEEVLEKYVATVKESDTFYKNVLGDDSGYSEEEGIEQLFFWTLLNASRTDLLNIEKFFIKYTRFVADDTFAKYKNKTYKIAKIFNDELYVRIKKATLAYETPFYFRFMLKNKVVEFPNIRYGISEDNNEKTAFIQAIQSSQEIPTNGFYYIVDRIIKQNLETSKYFREFNPMHLASLVLFLGFINGMNIKRVVGCDYFSLRYQRFALEDQKSENELHEYQRRLTNKFVNTFFRLLEYTDDIKVIKYPEESDEFILELKDKITFNSSVLQELYNIGYKTSLKLRKESNSTLLKKTI